MQNWIINMINLFGYSGIFLLIALENLFPPIPSEIILTFGGFLTTCTVLKPWPVVAAATAGSVVGAVLLYGVGRVLSSERLERFFGGKWGKLLGFKKGDISRAAQWFTRKGKSTVFFCRCIPIVRSLISIPAGTAGMKLSPFLLMTAAGTFLWNVLLVFLGAFAGESWETIAGYFDSFSTVTLLLIAALGAGLLLWFWRKRKKGGI